MKNVGFRFLLMKWRNAKKTVVRNDRQMLLACHVGFFDGLLAGKAVQVSSITTAQYGFSLLDELVVN